MPNKHYTGQQVSAYLTDEQIAALERFRKTHKLSKAEAIRAGLKLLIPDFPDNMSSAGNPNFKKSNKK